MAFCINCGLELSEEAKFCSRCGKAIESNNSSNQRETVYDGVIHKCPHCGEVLKSFEINCPSCGYELRGIKVSNAIKEFSLKLEEIEANRGYEKKRRISTTQAQQYISQTDEQKISLIKSFSVPNSKEDMLEFMILATSNMNMNTYDSTNEHISKGEKELNAAWFSKVEQVYEKAKRSYSSDDTFTVIKELFDGCNLKIKKAKKKNIIKWILLIGWIPLAWLVIILCVSISNPKEEANELNRLENIVVEVQLALDNGEYEHALNIADSIDYQRYDVEMERKWDIQRKYWIEKVLDEADKEEIELEYIPIEDIDNANKKPSNTESNAGFFEGFLSGIKPGLESTRENISEFNNTVNGEENTDYSGEE